MICVEGTLVTWLLVILYVIYLVEINVCCHNLLLRSVADFACWVWHLKFLTLLECNLVGTC